MFMLNSSQAVKVAHLQKLANQLMLSGALLVIEMVNNSFSESKKNFGQFDKARNVLVNIF